MSTNATPASFIIAFTTAADKCAGEGIKNDKIRRNVGLYEHAGQSRL